MLAPSCEGTNPLVSSNTSSESDTTPSHSPSPARSIKSRFARQYRSKRAQSQQLQEEENKNNSNNSNNQSISRRNSNNNRNKKQILVFINSSKSKSTRSLFNLAKRKRSNKNLNIASIIKSKSHQSLPTDPTSTHQHQTYINNKNMANVQQMKDQFEKNRRNSAGVNFGNAGNVGANYNKQFTYFNNGGNSHHPSKIDTKQFKRGGYSKNLPQKPYIVDNDDDHNNGNGKVDASHFRRNHRKDKEPNSPNRHHKSKSHIGLSPSAMSASRSKSPSARNNGNHYIGQTNGYHVNATHKYTGVCPHCNHEAPLLEYITASNRHSHLTELRDKLSAVETLASILKQQILQVQR